MPVNYLLVEALREYAGFFGDNLLAEYPTGSQRKLPLADIADDLSRRLISLFVPDADGRRPINGGNPILDHHPDWKDLVVFPEYFHGDNGAGLGAGHQTGWRALVVDLSFTLRR